MLDGNLLESKPVEFLKGTLRNPAAVGSIIPSSKYLAREYTRGIDVSEDKVVLEWGPGTGPVTAHFHEEMEDPSLYLGIEQDQEYVDVLGERCPEMHFVCGSAEDSIEHLEEVGLEEVDLIASELPFTTLPQAVQVRIYDQLEELMTPGTEFRAVILAPAYPTENSRRFRRRMNRMFGPFECSPLVWRNIPPAFVLTWRA
jgi:phospholipid N-methyltransferase